MSERGEPLEETARFYEECAAQLEQAVAHCGTAAQRFRDKDVPRGAAHAWAARGHLLEAQELLDRQARDHAERSTP